MGQKKHKEAFFPPRDRGKLTEVLQWSLDQKNQDTIQKQKDIGTYFIQNNFRYSSIAAQYIDLYYNISHHHDPITH